MKYVIDNSNPILKQLREAGPVTVLEHLWYRDQYEQAKFGGGHQNNVLYGERGFFAQPEMILWYTTPEDVRELCKLAEDELPAEVLPNATNFEPGYDRKPIETCQLPFDLVAKIFDLPGCVMAAQEDRLVLKGYLYLLVQEIWKGNSNDFVKKFVIVELLLELFHRRRTLPPEDLIGPQDWYCYFGGKDQ